MSLDLRRRHPVTKLLGVGLVVTTALVVSEWWVLAVVLVVVLLLTATQPRRPDRPAPLRTVGLAAVPVAALAGVIQLLLGDDWTAAAQLAGRLALLTASGGLFGSTTSATDLMTAAGQFRLDPRIGYVLASAVALLPRMRDRAAAVVEAQQARGLRLRGGPVRRLRALVTVTGPLLLSLVAENDERAAALQTRGFPGVGRWTAYRPLPFRTADRVVGAVLVVLLVGVVAATLLGSP